MVTAVQIVHRAHAVRRRAHRQRGDVDRRHGLVDVTTTKRWVGGRRRWRGPPPVRRRRRRHRRRAVPPDPVRAGPCWRRNPHRDLAVEIGIAGSSHPEQVSAGTRSRSGGGERDPETPISVVRGPASSAVTSTTGGWRSVLPGAAEPSRRHQPRSSCVRRRASPSQCSKFRNMAAARGLMPGRPVDYGRLMPATYADPLRGGPATHGAGPSPPIWKPDPPVPVGDSHDLNRLRMPSSGQRSDQGMIKPAPGAPLHAARPAS